MNPRLKESIERADVVSFDIFDTLLFRVYVKPTDLFSHMERAENADGFCAERIAAERRCRQKNSGREDITFDDIYNEIDGKFKRLKDAELECERRALRANPEVGEMFRFAKSIGKKVAIASDMYLPESFLLGVLQENGFGGADGVYISGALNKTKSGGSLFRHILEKFGIAPGGLLHIGDNRRSDCEIPRGLGIKCHHYKKISKRYFKKFKYLKKFYRARSGSFTASIITQLAGARLLLENSRGNFWRDLGYRLAGPAAFAYANFVRREAEKRNLTNLLFVARDGYLLREIYNLCGGAAKNSYVYAPRILRYIRDMESLAPKDAKRVLDFCAAAGMSKNAGGQGGADPARTSSENKALLLSKGYAENFRKYARKFVSEGDRVGIVDTATMGFSSQDLFETALGAPVFGLYWSNMRECARGFKFACFKPNGNYLFQEKGVFTIKWDLMEFLFSSPETSVKYVDADGSPVYAKNPPPEEVYRSEVYPDIAAGAMDFARDLLALCGGKDPEISADEAIECVNAYLSFPTSDDRREMSRISHTMDFDHKE
ncbi:MAG: hypothetical protein IJI37_01295, partial [Opitutales bacterium]|nr:hypothetical protein [Opitutales bacterium]